MNTSLRIENRPEKLEELWRRHVPPETIYDLWEYRQAFFNGTQEPLFVHTDDALLPLWRETDGWLTFFGGMYCERNRLPASTPVLRRMLDLLLAPADLPFLANEPPPLDGFDLYQNSRYELRSPSFDDYLAGFRSEHRRRLKRLEPLTVKEGCLSDLTRGFEWNVCNQEARGRVSLFCDASFCEGFGRMVASLYRMGVGHVLCLRRDDGSLVGVQAVAEYRGTLTLLNGGCSPDVSGNAVILATLRWALARRPACIDWMTDDTLPWKESRWHFQPAPVWAMRTHVAASDDGASLPPIVPSEPKK